MTRILDPGFVGVGDAFDRLFVDGMEVGAGLAVWHRGRPVVDLTGGGAGGPTGAADRSPWRADTLANVYSVGKPVAAFCLLMLVDRGRLGLDDPVCRHWPGFRATGVTVRHVLSHTAGLPVFPVARPASAFADWALLAGDLAAAGAESPPGAVAAEHALTYGHLVGELVRRIDGRSVGRFLAEEVAGPWGLDLWFGVPAAEQARCAELAYAVPDWPERTLGDRDSLRYRALANPSGAVDLAVVNGAVWRSAEVPAVNLHATAAALARFYAGLLAGGVLDGVRLLSPALMAEFLRVQHDGPDLLLDRPVRWSLGMQVEDDGSWGMGGIGGSVAYADPVRGFTFAYVTRLLGEFDRVDVLVDAVEAALPD